MGKFESDTICEFLSKMVEHLIDTHDSAEDGESTGGVISIVEQLKDLVRDDVLYDKTRAKYILEKLVEIAPDHGETLDPDDIQELADEINGWD